MVNTPYKYVKKPGNFGEAPKFLDGFGVAQGLVSYSSSWMAGMSIVVVVFQLLSFDFKRVSFGVQYFSFVFAVPFL